METLSSPWATIDDVTGDTSGLDPADLEDQLLIASEILFHVTGQQWPGIMRDTIRPNRAGCGCSHGRRGCTRVSEVELPGYPVTAIVTVTIDGVEIDDQLYRVDDNRWLVWTGTDPEFDGHSGWPCCQRQKLAATELDTFEVVYEFGAAPSLGGVRAAARLGMEFALAASSSSDCRQRCRLPSRVQSIVRQGVQMALIDNLELFAEGRTGLPDVDLWVGSILKGRERRRAGVIDTQAHALRGRQVRRNTLMPGS